MAMRVCAEPGCPELVSDKAYKGRCVACNRRKDKARGTRQSRGYGRSHDRLRARWQRRLDAGEQVACWRCNKLVDPFDWHLGHDDNDRTIYRGPEHPACNQATAGR